MWSDGGVWFGMGLEMRMEYELGRTGDVVIFLDEWKEVDIDSCVNFWSCDSKYYKFEEQERQFILKLAKNLHPVSQNSHFS